MTWESWRQRADDDVSVQAATAFLIEQYGTEIDAPYASWEADARQLLGLLRRVKSLPTGPVLTAS